MRWGFNRRTTMISLAALGLGAAGYGITRRLLNGKAGKKRLFIIGNYR